MSNSSPIQLGDIGVDLITGLKGVVTARKNHIYGCVHLRLERMGLDAKGQMIEPDWVDEQRIEKDGESKLPITPAPEIPFPLGSRIRDKISKFEGTATTFTVWYNGEIDVVIDPGTLHEGQPVPGYHIALPRIEVIEAKTPPVSKRSFATAGSVAAPAKNLGAVRHQ